MQCNIDQRGRTLRIVVGAIFESAGLALGALFFLAQASGGVVLGPAHGCDANDGQREGQANGLQRHGVQFAGLST